MDYQGISIEWLGHASFRIAQKNIIYLDPFQLKGEPAKADIVLITHTHYDHCSLEDIKKVLKQSTVVLGPVDAQSKVAKLGQINFRMVHPGDAFNVKGVGIRGFPAYNLSKPFHPKQNSWLGYLIEINGVKLYHAGDTDAVPELQELKGLDVLMLPIGGTYTMNAAEAASVANALHPKLTIPMHYGSIVGSPSDMEHFRLLSKVKVGNL
jgi:L-ascorbate metabolism protein UlaG (beta-lactamase superfamily)